MYISCLSSNTMCALPQKCNSVVTSNKLSSSWALPCSLYTLIALFFRKYRGSLTAVQMLSTAVPPWRHQSRPCFQSSTAAPSLGFLPRPKYCANCPTSTRSMLGTSARFYWPMDEWLSFQSNNHSLRKLPAINQVPIKIRIRAFVEVSQVHTAPPVRCTC
jgi:hypothetical protein